MVFKTGYGLQQGSQQRILQSFRVKSAGVVTDTERKKVKQKAQEEDGPGQNSGYRYSEGEEHGYSSGGSRGTPKHRHGSGSRRLRRQGGLSSSENQKGSEKGAMSPALVTHGVMARRHGSSSWRTEERNKSHVSPSRVSGDEYKSGCGRWRGHGGLSYEYESNSTQPKLCRTKTRV